ncbi:MAG: NUDIX hydrolase [Clostridia bacterium]
MNFKEEIINYIPYNAQEEKDKQVMLEYINKFDDILVRTNEIAHMTSSSWIVNKNRDKVLMIFHNIYNSWSWTGGHADGESNFLDVAIKEAKEETSVINIKPITNEIIALDILPVWGHIKRGKYVSSHQHLNVTYLLEADENDELSIKADENSGVKWVPFNEVKYFCSEPEMLKVYNKIAEKIKR